MNVPKTVMSVDIGILHMGLVSAVIENGRVASLPFVRLIDLTRLRHERVPYASCTLHHSNEFGDRFEHFVQEYGHIFDAADLVLIERQPITGLQAVQQLLFLRYREKVVLLSPNAMHKHMKMSGSYAIRKLQTVRIMRDVFDTIPHDASQLSRMDRTHDVADAICLLLFYCDTVLKQRLVDRKEKVATVEAFEKNGRRVSGIFDRFRYKPIKRLLRR